MSIVVKLAPELRNWVLHNLNRGCDANDLVGSMINEKFEPDIAREIVAAFANAHQNGAPPPTDSLTLDVPPPTYQCETPRLPSGNMIHADDMAIAVLARFEQPVIAVLGQVLSRDECTQLIELSRDRLQPSTVVDPESGENSVAAYRNSEGMFFKLEETPFIAQLDRRISALMNMPVSHGEGLQVLRYTQGGNSAPHFDFLIPSNATNQASLERSGQRVSSLVIYLNDVMAGGETVFPEIGFSICPQPGNAVYFEYCNSRGQVDYQSLHAGAPVIEGEKWVATKWMRERRFISG